MMLNDVFGNVKRHAELLTDRQKGGTTAQTECNANDAFYVPAALSHQEIADGIFAQLDFDAVVEASFESESSASKKGPDKAKIAAAAKKHLTGAVRSNIENNSEANC